MQINDRNIFRFNIRKEHTSILRYVYLRRESLHNMMWQNRQFEFVYHYGFDIKNLAFGRMRIS